MSTLVTIVTPAYNAERFIAQTIESVIAQTVADWELVIVDDGSSDSTAKIIEGYASRDKRIRGISQANGGVAKARNTGVAHTDQSVPYIIFLDSDDVWEPNTLKKLVNALDTAPEAVASFGRATKVDVTGKALPLSDEKSSYYTPTKDSMLYDFSRWCPINTPGVILIRRSILNEVGEFDQTVAPCEDWDLYIRLLRRGNFTFIDESVIRYRQHSGNASGNSARMEAQGREVIRKAISSPENKPGQAGTIRKGYRSGQVLFLWAKLGFALDALKHGDPRGAFAQFKPMVGGAIRILRGAP